MRSRFPSREQLMAMPIRRLRGLDIAEKDEEELVQEILNAKLAKLPPEQTIKLRIPDIKSPEEEKIWQQKVDDTIFEMKKRSGILVDEPEEEVEHIDNQLLETDVPEVNEEIQKGEEAVETEENVDGPIKCLQCGSKGFRHKRNCPASYKLKDKDNGDKT